MDDHSDHLRDSLLSLQRYTEAVIENAPFGIIVIDVANRIATVNPAALQILDLNRDDVHCIGEPAKPSRFEDLLVEGERPRFLRLIDKAVTTRQEFSDPRYFFKTGYQDKVLSVKITPISQLPHGCDGIIIAVEDITDKVLMEKYVILSEKLVAKGEMAASIAHELNNYLAIMATNAELMGMNLDREKFDKARNNAKSIVDNIFNIKRFVDNLMDFSRPESEFVSYDIRRLIEDMLFSLRVQPRFKETQFSIDLDSETPEVEIDVGQIQQVLFDLLNNSADAIKEKSLQFRTSGDEFRPSIGVRSSYYPDKELVIVEISDNGIGIREEQLAKVFNMHYTTKKLGRGIGLTNCKRIIEDHGGDIFIQSSPKTGTTVKFVLHQRQG